MTWMLMTLASLFLLLLFSWYSLSQRPQEAHIALIGATIVHLASWFVLFVDFLRREKEPDDPLEDW